MRGSRTPPADECPICKQRDATQLIHDEGIICLRCEYAWLKDDEDKSSWVCPTHKNPLKAYLSKEGSDREIRLWCRVCNVYYVIPDNIQRKIKRAFILREEI